MDPAHFDVNTRAKSTKRPVLISGNEIHSPHSIKESLTAAPELESRPMILPPRISPAEIHKDRKM